MEFYKLFFFFVVVITIYRIRRLCKSYTRPVGKDGHVYYPASYIILIGIYLFLFLGAILEFLSLRIKHDINWWYTTLGVIMYVSVIPLRWAALKELGKYMSPEIEIKDYHKLVTTGPYGYLRHPLSLCVVVELAGFTLVPNAYFCFVGVLVIFLPYVLLRTYLEDKVLLERFGAAYLNYKRRVPAFLSVKQLLFRK